jgi:hypothetical protein
MFSINKSTNTEGTVRLASHEVGFRAQNIDQVSIEIDRAKSRLIRKWLSGFVTNRSVAYSKVGKLFDQSKSCPILLSFLSELDRKPFYTTFKSVHIYRDKYRSLKSKKHNFQNEVLEAILNTCEKLHIKYNSNQLN